MLVDALPVWGSAVHQNYCYIRNRAGCVVCGLHGSEHVSRQCQVIDWLFVPLLTHHHTVYAMLEQYTS